MAIILRIHRNPKQEYIEKHGCHFTEDLCSYAVSLMTKNRQPLKPVSKDVVDKLLEQYNIHLQNNKGYDYIFIANMCKADYYGSSIEDDKHYALYIKDSIDDEDIADGTILKRWVATMKSKDIEIDWNKFI